jgi:hypothetical protein
VWVIVIRARGKKTFLIKTRTVYMLLSVPRGNCYLISRPDENARTLRYPVEILKQKKGKQKKSPNDLPSDFFRRPIDVAKGTEGERCSG